VETIFTEEVHKFEEVSYLEIWLCMAFVGYVLHERIKEPVRSKAESKVRHARKLFVGCFNGVC